MPVSRAVRYRCDVPAKLERGDGKPEPVRVLDISESGAFIETELDLQFGDTGLLGVALPGGPPWVVEVAVVRLGSSQREIPHQRVDTVTVTRLGAGLRFEGMATDELKRLRSFLELLDER